MKTIQEYTDLLQELEARGFSISHINSARVILIELPPIREYHKNDSEPMSNEELIDEAFDNAQSNEHDSMFDMYDDAKTLLETGRL